jgi:hypothetical protein
MTKEELLAWLGSDANKDALIQLLLEIANDDYSPDDLRRNVNDYNQGEEK